MKDTQTCIPSVKGKDLKPVGVGKHSIYDVRPTGDTIYYPWVQMAEVHVKHGDAIRIILLDKEGNGFSSIFINPSSEEIDIDISNWRGEHTVKMYVPVSRLKRL